MLDPGNFVLRTSYFVLCIFLYDRRTGGGLPKYPPSSNVGTFYAFWETFGALCCGSGRVFERTFATIYSLLTFFLLFCVPLCCFCVDLVLFGTLGPLKKTQFSSRWSSKSHFMLYSHRAPPWTSLGDRLGSLAGLLATSCVRLGASWGILGDFLGPSWVLGASLGNLLGGLLGPPGRLEAS